MATIANFPANTYASGSAVGITYTGLNGAGGDGGLALWRVESAVPVFARPACTLLARPNKARNARHFDMRLTIPYTVLNSVTNQVEPVSRALFAGSWILPSDCPSWVHEDLLTAVVSAANANVAQMKTGFGPT